MVLGARGIQHLGLIQGLEVPRIAVVFFHKKSTREAGLTRCFVLVFVVVITL